MDGAPLLTVQWAHDKAYTAAGMGMGTDGWYPMIKDDGALMTGVPHGDRVVVFGGGYPIFLDGQLLGGIGVSGGTYADDMKCAQMGLEKLGFSYS